MRSGIYCIENLINKSMYVGQSINLDDRMNRPHIGCWELRKAFKEFGEENFRKYILEECSEELLNERETFWIKKLHTHISEGGYNIIPDGKTSPMRGKKHSQKTKRKISLSLIGNKRSLGHKQSDATKKKRSDSIRGKYLGENSFNFGRKHTDEQNKKQSEREMGINHPSFGKKRKNSSSKYFGVKINISNHGNNTYWIANISINGKKIYIGNYILEIEAARAYDKYVVEHKLPNPLNFPKDYK